MTCREAICAEALLWQGTPYHHHAAIRGLGVDCVGLAIGVSKALAVLPATWQPGYYSPEWHLHHHEEALLTALVSLGCTSLPLEARQPGDLLTFAYGKVSSHVGILVARDPEYVVHAARDIGRVVQQRLAGSLLARVRRAYCFPGVTA